MRKLLVISLLIGFSSIVAANPSSSSIFQGFYVGANATFDSLSMTDQFIAKVDYSATGIFPAGTYGNSVTHTNYSYGENLFAGYNFQVSSRFLLGVEARILAANKSNEANVDTTVSLPPEYQPPASISFNTTRNLMIDNGAINLLVKPEFLLSPQQMIYGLLGAGYARTDLNNDFTSEISNISISIGEIDLDKIVIPFTFGLGYAQYLTTHLSWSAEVSDTLYPDIKGNLTVPPSALIPQVISFNAAATKISMVSANLGLSYYFNGI